MSRNLREQLELEVFKNKVTFFASKFDDKCKFWFNLSYNRKLKLHIIHDFADKPWDWWTLSYNPSITMADMS